MERLVRARKFLFTAIVCINFMFMAEACSEQPEKVSDIVDWENETPLQAEEEYHTDAVRIAEICHDAYEEAARTESPDLLKVMQNIVRRLGENGFAAIDSENQIDMVNAEQVLVFCDAVDAKKSAELTVIQIIDIENLDRKSLAACVFRKYDFRTENGRVDVDRGYYCFDGYGNLEDEDRVNYSADLWQYTEDGYLVFAGSYYADDYYIISLTDESEYAAFRVEPLDAECRELYRKYIQPVGYEGNNLFLVDWTEEDFGDLDFYDLFDRFYPMLYRKTSPYTASENPGIGTVYRIAENEFEEVVGMYLNIDINALRLKTSYFPGERTYEYKPRGFYELECSNMPYPEVADYTENSDNTVTLTVNAVFPYECTSRAFSHEVVIRLLEDGSFQYVSNKIIESNCDVWWRAERLTDDEWEEIYAGQDTIDTEENTKQYAPEKDISLWYLPQTENCLLTEPEKDELKTRALEAAGLVTKVYRNAEIEEGASYASNVKNFSNTQCEEVTALLGEAGFISVTENANMENYQELELFYDKYRNGHDATVTVFNVNRDGLIGAITFVYRNIDKKDVIQTYYIGIGWQEGGVPTIKNTQVSDVAEMHLTEKGYFIYTYKEPILHSGENQYWRVKPLSKECRELTEKYLSGLSFTNYNAFVIDWDISNVEDILSPYLFEDIYRIDTGENIDIGIDWIPAAVYERIMTTYFPVSKGQLRSKCRYDADKDSYPYEMIFAVPYAPFGEVVNYAENADGTLTLYVDGVWIDYNSDYAFANEIVVQPFADGTFRYLSNKIRPKELELPSIASAVK